MAETYSTYEAKAKLSEILRKVARGRTIRISRRGEPIAEIRPLRREPAALEERIGELRERLSASSLRFPDRALTVEIEAVLDAAHLRGAEAWHLACALYLSPDPRELAFLTMDRQQARVAAALGFADRI